MKATGIGLTPEDRKKQGLVLVFPVENNLTLASLHRVSSIGILNPGKEQVLAETMVENLAIKTARSGCQDENAERRQSAKGRHRQLAEHPAASADDG